MNLDFQGFEHEIASVIVGAIVSWFGNKAMRVTRDVQCLWPRLRAVEDRLKLLEGKEDVSISSR